MKILKSAVDSYKKSKYFEDLEKLEVKEYLLNKNLYHDFPFLMEQKNFEDLYLWLTTYCSTIPYSYNQLELWIVQFSQQRQKKLNGGY
tara:strand:- start:6286 stop:6549 length:264 start_codon:yes stop_codon:yes gene_type:complete